MEKFPKIFQSGRIGNLELKNRLVMSAMGTSNLRAEGFIYDRITDYYVARARGGVGLILAISAVNPESRAGGVHSIDSDIFLPGLRRLTAAVHEEGIPIMSQLVKWGLRAFVMDKQLPQPYERVFIVPSLPLWLKKYSNLREASVKDIEQYVNEYVEAAWRAKEAGFDGVEIHGTHGCMVVDYLSPLTNIRNDDYGGSPEKRARFACQIITGIKKRVGSDFPVTIRINGEDNIDGGTTIEDAVRQAIVLEDAGADAITVSGGISYDAPLKRSRVRLESPSYLSPPGTMVSWAASVKKAVKIPVIATGRIDAFLGEQLLKEGKADFIALGRPLLADPELPNKLREGRLEDIRPCIYCNACVVSISVPPDTMMPEPIRFCVINPGLYREMDFIPKPAKSTKKIMIIGGGLAGMEAATLLAQRGHKVSLYERSNKLGGQWNIVSAEEFKQGHLAIVEYLAHSLNKAGVRITLNQEVNRRFVEEIHPDAVIVATGAFPRSPDIPGVDGINVVQANDVITGKARLGNSVVVVGGRILGMELALSLSKQGIKVALVTKDGLGKDGDPLRQANYRIVAGLLIEQKVPLYLYATVTEITGKGIYMNYEGDVFLLEADTVVLAVGTASDNRLAGELQGLVPELYTIGDCVKPRDGRIAIYEAARLALSI